MPRILIYGLAVKTSDRYKGDYSDIELEYDVDDSVTIDDVDYYLHKHNVRVAPVRENGEKFEGVVAFDTDTKRGGAKMGRIAFGKQLQKDLRSLSWKEDTRQK